MLQLTSAERSALRARTHDLNPVVSISENGLTEAVLKEINVCLSAHELIKIRVYGDSRENRLAYLEQICTELNAATVQHIGKLLVVYRPSPAVAAAEKAAQRPASRRPAAAPRKSKRSFQG